MNNMTDSDLILKKQDLVLRDKINDYSKESITKRIAWLNSVTNKDIPQISSNIDDAENNKKNIENFIGYSRVPVGIAGPIKINGQHANGLFYIPMSTTEGTLVETYHRGMLSVTKSGGATIRITKDALHVSPMFILNDLADSLGFVSWINNNFTKIKKEAESTTKHGRLISIDHYLLGRRVILKFSYYTQDAMGMNMINIATDKACKFICCEQKVEHYYLRCNFSSDKKPSFYNFINGYSKEITAEVVFPRKILQRYLNTTPESIIDFWHSASLGSMQAGILGINAHFANGLAAIYLACGQDIAQIVNSCTGINNCEINMNGDLYAFIKLPSLVIGTIGGGTGLGTQKECLDLMGCYGQDKSNKFAEIITGVLLAGEIAIGAALASGYFIDAHLALKNR